MFINLNNITIKLYNDSKQFTEDDIQYFQKYVEESKIINNKNNFLKLNNKIFGFDEKINFENYDFSDRFFNIKIIMALLEIFNLTSLDTYEIYNFFCKNKKKYNIWKYLNSSEYINDSSLEYDNFVIIRLCITYSWKECLYDLLNQCLKKNRVYKIYIWLDIFCVNQFNSEIKMKGLNKIKNIYYIADIYNISSMEAFNRYWCCYEMSLNKKANDIIILNKNEIIKDKINNEELKEIFNEIFKNDKLFCENNKEIEKYVIEFKNNEKLKKNKFSLKNVNITRIEDKDYINNKILERYKTISEYEKRIDIYIKLIIYRDDMSYGYLANKIMNYNI